MKRILNIGLLATFLVGLTPFALIAQDRDRSEIPTQYKWRLEDIYESDEAWDSARDAIAGRFDEVLQYRGKLADSAATMQACLDLQSEISKEVYRLSSYASMKSDQDKRNSTYLGMEEEIQQLVTDYSSKASFISPEITEMDTATIDKFLEEDPGLAIYEMYLSDLQRTKKHRLSADEEKILAETGLLSSAPVSAYGIFSDAELPYPEITLSDGTEAVLNKAGFARLRAVPNAADREAVFKTFFGGLANYKQTFGSLLSSQVKADMFYARVRNYDSALHRSLDANNIPVDVYHALIDGVHKNLDSFHRYLKLRQRMLGVEQLKYSDMYASVVAELDLEFTYEEAMKLTLDSVVLMGEDYSRVVKRSFDERWIDVYPNPGKRSGAYCNGSCYDVHPYMLLNYNGQYDDVSTLAHEMGHAMHSYYSNKNQPFATADYATFVAEVASTLNEALLIDMMLKRETNDDVKLSLLMSYLDGVKGTVFRQTQFAEFELAIHEAAESGEPLTGDSLTKIYGDIIKKYYGHDKGVCEIDEAYCIEWAYVPHFYYEFYVYQYATSFTASTALAERILKGEPDAVPRTMEFLSAGGSDYPVAILKKAGVDMTTSQPLDNTIARMNRVMDQIEAILDKKAAADQN